jgi:NAD(P)-dependent dehydrogenase (short-subunit alcohol dehydrogenase family)
MSNNLSRPSRGKNCLIAGAGGGIGLALLERLIDDPSIERIVATHRAPVTSTNTKVVWRNVDFERPHTIAATHSWLGRHLEHLDYFLCATGCLHDGSMKPEKSLRDIDAGQMQRSLLINAVGPLQLLALLAPLMKRSTAPKVMLLSAQVGSIEDNGLGGWYSYRAAKSALNMGLKTAAIEAARWRTDPVFMSVHPGTTHSALSKPFVGRRKQPVRSTACTAAALHNLLSRATSEHHGGFYNARGDRLPW